VYREARRKLYLEPPLFRYTSVQRYKEKVLFETTLIKIHLCTERQGERFIGNCLYLELLQRGALGTERHGEHTSNTIAPHCLY